MEKIEEYENIVAFAEDYIIPTIIWAAAAFFIGDLAINTFLFIHWMIAWSRRHGEPLKQAIISGVMRYITYFGAAISAALALGYPIYYLGGKDAFGAAFAFAIIGYIAALGGVYAIRNK